MLNLIALHGMDNRRAIGLFHGQMGLVITIALYARRYEKMELDDIADCLMANITTRAKFMDDMSFGYGLSGVCWGIEYLSQNGIVQGSANDICESVDERICRTDVTAIDDYSLETGLLGLWHYVWARVQGNLKASLPLPFSREYLEKWLNILQAKADVFPPDALNGLVQALNGTLVEKKLSVEEFVKLPKRIDPEDLSLRNGAAGRLLTRYVL